MPRIEFRTRPGLASFLWGLLYALLMALAFPPADLGFLAFFALAPLCVIALKTPKPWRSAVMVGLAGLPLWFYHERYLIDVTIAGYPILAAMMAMYTGLFVWIGARLRMSRPFAGRPALVLLALPVLWTGFEVCRGAIVFNGYPWYLIAHPTVGFTPWAVHASVIGVYGVGLLMAAIASAMALLIEQRGRPGRAAVTAIITALCFGVVVSLGAAMIGLRAATARDASAEELRLAVVQTNVPQDNKSHWAIDQRLADFEHFLALTAEAASAEPRPDVILWPETMFPGWSLNPEAVEAERAADLTMRTPRGPHRPTDFHDRLVETQSALGAPLIIGALARDGLHVGIDEDGFVRFEQEGLFNSAFLVQGGAVSPVRYDKLKLTPFGEEMPYISASDWLESKLLAIGAAGMTFELDAGDEPTLLRFRAGGEGGREVRVATPICFEATMPAVCRRLVYGPEGRRADFVANLTNDGWFGRWRGGREKHLQIARWRAIELGVPVVRAANTGVSSAIDPLGNVIRRGPDGRKTAVNVDGVMHVSIAMPDQGWATTYGRLGDWVGWPCLALTAGLAAWTFVPCSRRRNGAAAGGES